MRSRRLWGVRASALLVASGVVLTGCSGPTTTTEPGAQAPVPAPPAAVPGPAPTPEALAWARTVCSALEPVPNALSAPPGINLRDTAATRQAYVDYLARARGAVDGALEKVTAAGPPPVEAGQRAREQLRADLTDLRDDVVVAQDQIARLDPGNAESVAKAFAAANNVVGSLGDGVQTLVGLDTDSELSAALRQTPECRPLLPDAGN